jgi:hypothetical protein
MGGADVLEHVDERVPRHVAVPVVAPVARSRLGGGGRALLRPAARRLAAVGVTAGVVVQVQVEIAEVQHFERRRTLLSTWIIKHSGGVCQKKSNRWQFWVLRGWFWPCGSEVHRPLEIRVVQRTVAVEQQSAGVGCRDVGVCVDEHYNVLFNFDFLSVGF